MVWWGDDMRKKEKERKKIGSERQIVKYHVFNCFRDVYRYTLHPCGWSHNLAYTGTKHLHHCSTLKCPSETSHIGSFTYRIACTSEPKLWPERAPPFKNLHCSYFHIHLSHDNNKWLGRFFKIKKKVFAFSLLNHFNVRWPR